jgi:hypothetical protein
MWYVKLIIKVWVLIIVLVSSSIGYGHANSVPNGLEKLGFGLCAGKPCFWGIILGQTKWNDARAIIEKNGAVPSSIPGTYFFGQLEITLNTSVSDIVSSITIWDDVGAPLPVMAGDIIANWGVPCTHELDPYRSFPLELTYPHARVEMSFGDVHMTPATPINYIFVSTTDMDCKHSIPWPGFTTAQRFNDLYLKQTN